MLPCNSSDSSDWLKICLYKYGTCPSIKSRMKQYLIFNCNYHSMKCRKMQSCQVLSTNSFPIWEQVANNKFSFCRKLQQGYFWFSTWSLMIPLDKLSRSHFDIYKIPDTSSRIYNKISTPYFGASYTVALHPNLGRSWFSENSSTVLCPIRPQT